MALIHDIVTANLPIKRKKTSKGWTAFNAVCCHHRGHNQDTRSRGNMLLSPEGAIAYNCYNCGFKAVYSGQTLSKNFESLMGWLGVSYDDIKRVKMELLSEKIESGFSTERKDYVFSYSPSDFNEVKLPDGAKPMIELLETANDHDFLTTIEYLAARGESILLGWNYYWSDQDKWNLKNRVIIPFYFRDKIVGWTARYAGTPPPGIPRYFNSDLQTGYLFNCDALYKYDRKYAVIVEGPFDAIAIDGVATLGSELSREQTAWLNSSDLEKIVLPDRQRKNQGLIDAALANGWAVSFPDWEYDIKDAADAAKRYGKLYTLKTVIDSKTTSHLEINVKRRMFKE